MLVKSKWFYSKITAISRVSQVNNNLTCENGNNTHIDERKQDTFNVEKHVTISHNPILSSEREVKCSLIYRSIFLN